jgi:Domain of unknown function (DUF4276)
VIRLHFVVEGQAEESFVNSVLAIHLGAFNISADVRCVATSRTRNRTYRGGLLDYARAKKDLVLWMKEDQNPDAYFTTMFDLFRLPEDFPGYATSKGRPDAYERVDSLEAALSQDLSHRRFVPYIQLHEFEALILSDPRKLGSEFAEHADQIQQLVQLCSAYSSPELIDDGPLTAPSKRIIACIPAYEGRKVSAAVHVIQEIGLGFIRLNCPHLDAWMRKLEQLGSPGVL